MGTTTAFISELHTRTGQGPAEFHEITILASEDPADYTVSFYTPTGTLQTAIPVTGASGGDIVLCHDEDGFDRGAFHKRLFGRIVGFLDMSLDR